jgi:hypothetical protein
MAWSSLQSAACSGVWIDFRIASIVGAGYNASKIGAYGMLELQPDWRRYPGGPIALGLLEQIPIGNPRIQFSRYLIRASLELAVRTFFGRRNPVLKVDEISPNSWSIGGLRYLFLPEVDDDAPQKCRETFRDRGGAFLIVPTGCEVLIRYALEKFLNGAVPNMQTFEEFICWRTSFAAMDADWSREKVMCYLVSRYNFHVSNTGLGSSLMIRMPPNTTDLSI